MSDQENTLDNILFNDFNKKERSIWDNDWMINDIKEPPRPPLSSEED